VNAPLLSVSKEFRAFVREIDERDEVLSAALALDRAFYPDLDTEWCRTRIAELGEGYAERIRGHFDPRARFELLGEYLGRDRGYSGEPGGLENADNAFLHKVLRSRHGFPISLSVLYVSVAAHANVPASGIGLPGHFIVGHLGLKPPAFLDPYRNGQLFSREACDRIVREVTQGRATSAARYLAPTRPRAFLTRMLNNLQMAFWRGRDDERGLLAARLQCVLNPHAPDSYRARAHVYDRLGDVASALADYEDYLRREPKAADAARVRKRISHLRAALRDAGGRREPA